MSYPKLHLPLHKLKALFQQQLRVEMATTVSVESVEKPELLTTEVLQAVRSPLPVAAPRVWEVGWPPAWGGPWGRPLLPGE